MVKGRKVLIAFLGTLLFAAAVRADMMPVPQRDADSPQSPAACEPIDLKCRNLSHPAERTCLADLNEYSFKFLPEADAKAGQDSELQNLRILTDGSDSLKLCLSALISLGLCFSAHWVKRLSLGFIPEWYHTGGPFQIGHSNALMPGTLTPAPACCFIQPSCIEDNPLPQHFIKTVISIWRKSQFTPDVIASRGPPNMS